ncbi:MAG: phosphate ABC transporter substrate-binding protein PstS [Acidobacteriaceae bacterium]
MKIGSRAALLAATALLGLTACKSNNSESSQTVTLTGAGSTFVYPVMTRWTQDYQTAHHDVQINYQSIGSGGGIQQVKQGTVDFGASDAALDDQQLAAMRPILQMPESAGPVCVTYNLPELKVPLRLSPEALAGIFLGNIKRWQDPAIKRDNPGVNLPDAPVVVVHRADGSGTSNIFTTYLAEVSKDWASKVGKGTQVSWPAGNGGKGSEGVTGQVQQAPGAIGYVELTYAQQNHLPVALIKNQAGKYIAPSPESTSAAISGFSEQLAQDVRKPIVNAPATATNAYPISGLTFLLVPKDGQNQPKRQALKNFIKYIVTDGQTVAGSLNYAPLPDAVKQNDLKLLDTMTGDGKPLL